MSFLKLHSIIKYIQQNISTGAKFRLKHQVGKEYLFLRLFLDPLRQLLEVIEPCDNENTVVKLNRAIFMHNKESDNKTGKLFCRKRSDKF